MTATATRSQRPNTYPGTCSGCGSHVAAQGGVLGGRVDGRWTVRHTECPTTPAPTATATRRPAPRYSDCDNGHRYYRAGCYACSHQIGL